MEEIALRIRVYGDASLRRKARLVRKITKYHRVILSQMAQLMYAESGVGLAAPQVGFDEAMLVVDIGSGLYKLINPVIVRKQGRQSIEEGCLSVPGVCIKVKRAKNVIIQAQDEDGRPISLNAEDLLACVMQHEIDHLQGKLIVDYAPLFKKISIRKKLEAMKQASKNEKMHQSNTKSCELQL
ncbi:MAG: peptide deformylase [Candidatus Omnitrophota bacterium]|nr:MAG: peptide deformylase [Candidatus Omnitrophota bacterium]